MKKSIWSDGFTLIEIMISIAIFAILMLIILSTTVLSNKSSNKTVIRSELQQEMLNAQQLIGARVKEAVYIYNGSGGDNANTIVLGTGTTTKNPLDGSGTWKINRDNILALVLPPKLAPGTCGTGNTNDCLYRFFAYYPVLRSVLVSAGQLPDSPGNGNQWVIMEYRSYFPSGLTFDVGNNYCLSLASKVTLSAASPPLYLQPVSSDISQAIPGSCRPPLDKVANSGITARVLADYILPVDTTLTTTGRLFDYTDLVPTALQTPPSGSTETDRQLKAKNYGASGVSINLATQATFRGITYRFPETSDTVGSSTYKIRSTSFNANFSKYSN